MRQLRVPAFDAIETYDQCVSEVPDFALRGRLTANRGLVSAAFTAYDNASGAKNWHGLPRCAWGNSEQLVIGDLTKGELSDLYSKRMVTSSGTPRRIYDAILVAAAGRCPLCGGIGHAAGLDHYLPKAYFPAYSVAPQNLVPSCQDCNKGVGSSFAIHAHEQVLHPYFDDVKYFEQRWVTIRFIDQDIRKFVFEVAAPVGWTVDEVRRVRAHFKSFDLERRYGVEAAAELANVLHIRDSLGHAFSQETFRRLLSIQARSPAFDLNGWRRTFYEGLSRLDWPIEEV